MPNISRYYANVLAHILIVILLSGCIPITSVSTTSNFSLKVEDLSNEEVPDATIEYWLQVQSYDLFQYVNNKITDLNPNITVIDGSQYWNTTLPGKTDTTLQNMIDSSIKQQVSPKIDYLILLQCRTIWCPWDWSKTRASSFIYDLKNNSVLRQAHVRADGEDWAIPVYAHFHAETDRPAIDALINDVVDSLPREGSGDTNVAIFWLTENNILYNKHYEKDIYRTEGVCGSTLYILPCYRE
jgi:hypothetical protein